MTTPTRILLNGVPSVSARSRAARVRRGEIWAYQSISRIRPVLVVSADALNDAGEPLVVDVTPTGPAGVTALLSVELPDGHGYARCRWINTGEPKRFAERLATVPLDVMERVNMAL